ncbi:MAG: hypothetical protein ABJM26_11175 [Anderseniella sp.]
MSSALVKLRYEFGDKKSFVQASLTKKGTIDIVNPRTGKTIFWLNVEKSDFVTLQKIFSFVKKGETVKVSSGDFNDKIHLVSHEGKKGQLSAKAKTANGSVFAELEPASSASPEPNVMAVGSGVIIVAIIAITIVSLYAIKNGATVTGEIDAPNGVFKFGVDGDGPPRIPGPPDGGGDGDSGDEDENDGDGPPQIPGPNPGNNTPPPPD